MAAFAAFWVLRPLPLRTPTVDVAIEPHTSVRALAQAVVNAGVDVDATGLYWFFRLSGQSRGLRAGSYELVAGHTALDLLRKLPCWRDDQRPNPGGHGRLGHQSM